MLTKMQKAVISENCNTVQLLQVNKTIHAIAKSNSNMKLYLFTFPCDFFSSDVLKIVCIEFFLNNL